MTPTASWTDEQRKLLVECCYHMTLITGHDFSECLYEFRRVSKKYKQGKANEDGSEKDGVPDKE